VSMEQGTLSLNEAAQQLGVSQKTVRRWIQSGRLHAYKEHGPYGEQYRVPLEAIGTAQQVLDVVKVERPTDPRVLALAVAQALEEREIALRTVLHDEIATLRQQITELNPRQSIKEETTALHEQIEVLHQQVTALTEALTQAQGQQERGTEEREASLRAWLDERLPASPTPAESADDSVGQHVQPPEKKPWWKLWA
jgi:excisionase family DNA binding protein